MADESPPKPLIFAHKVIQQLVSHSMGEEAVLSRDDFATIRVAFRSSGGSWELIWQGSPDQMNLLKRVIQQWGQTYEPPVQDLEGLV